MIFVDVLNKPKAAFLALSATLPNVAYRSLDMVDRSCRTVTGRRATDAQRTRKNCYCCASDLYLWARHNLTHDETRPLLLEGRDVAWGEGEVLGQLGLVKVALRGEGVDHLGAREAVERAPGSNGVRASVLCDG